MFQFYYSLIALTIVTVLQEESQYLAGNRSQSESKFNSVLEPEISHGNLVQILYYYISTIRS